MSVYNDQDAFSKTVLGLRAQKSLTAVTNGSQALFTITGIVAITGIIGQVTVAMDGTTTSINLTHDPTIGSAVDLCAATVVISDVAGTIYGYLGAAITTLLVSSGTTAPGEAYAPFPTVRQALTAGQIFLKGTAADAGDTTWYCFWVPVSPGATLVAA